MLEGNRREAGAAPAGTLPGTAGCPKGPHDGRLFLKRAAPGPLVRFQAMVFFSRPRILNTAFVCNWETLDSVILSTIPISFMVSSSK